MKTIRLISNILVTAALLCSVQGCTMYDTEAEENVTENANSLLQVCKGKTIVVTAKKVICGYGVWDNLWLELPDDLQKKEKVQYFQPYSINKRANYTPKEGDMLRISYGPAPKDNRYKDVIICMAYPGPSRPVHIVCIEKIGISQKEK